MVVTPRHLCTAAQVDNRWSLVSGPLEIWWPRPPNLAAPHTAASRGCGERSWYPPQCYVDRHSTS